MTHEDCKRISDVLWEQTNLTTEDIQDIEVALDKQILKKPIQTHHCPNCETGLDVIEIIKDEYKDVCRECCKPPFCKWCGQALKWEE